MRSQLLKVSAIVLAGALVAPLTFAQEEADAEAPPPPTPQEIAAENLDQLLNLVKQGQARASSENAAREARFTQDKANQAAALKRAEEERAREERRSARLEKQFEQNELLIAAKQEQLRERLGTLSEFVFTNLYDWTLPAAFYVVVSSVAVVVVTASGFRGIDKVALWMTPAMLLLVVHAAFTSVDAVDSWESPVEGATAMTMAAAISAVVGSYIAGVIIQPDYSRYARNRAHAVGAAFVALGVSFPIVMFLAAIPGQALEQIDLRGLMLAMGIGLPAFALLFLGAWSSNVLCLYSSSLSAATVFSRLDYRLAVIFIGVVGTALGLISAQTYLIGFLVLLGITVPPVGAIYVVEALLLAPPKDTAPHRGESTESGTNWRAVGAWVGSVAFGFLVNEGVIGISGVAAIDVIVFSASAFYMLSFSRWPWRKTSLDF